MRRLLILLSWYIEGIVFPWMFFVTLLNVSFWSITRKLHNCNCRSQTYSKRLPRHSFRIFMRILTLWIKLLQCFMHFCKIWDAKRGPKARARTICFESEGSLRSLASLQQSFLARDSESDRWVLQCSRLLQIEGYQKLALAMHSWEQCSNNPLVLSVLNVSRAFESETTTASLLYNANFTYANMYVRVFDTPRWIA